jgi:Zn-finger nucleic acid-binding protein
MSRRRHHLAAHRAPGRRDRLLPECRGVWLDRGEVDKLLRRDGDHDNDSDRDRRRAGTHRSGHPTKKGWLSDLFEFGE